MTIRSQFQLYSFAGEQNLIKSLTEEAVQIHGQDLQYIPKRRQNYDAIYGADDMSLFDSYYTLEFYIESFGGFSGENTFMSKFGVEIRDQVFFSVAKTRFDDVIGTPEDIERPREGDLIYFPMNGRTFEIKWVDTKPIFYPTGVLTYYRITAELFEYSNERLRTGIAAVDALEQTKSLDINQHAYTDQSNASFIDNSNSIFTVDDFDLNVIDKEFNNEQLTSNAAVFVDFTDENPFGDITE